MAINIRTTILTLLMAGIFCLPATAADDTSDIEKRLANVERLLQNQGLLDLWEQLHKLQSEVAKLRGQLEVTQHELQKLKEKQRRLYNDLDSRLQALGKQSRSAPGEPPLGNLASDQSAAPPVEGTEGETLTLSTVNATKRESGTSTSGEEPDTLPGPGTDTSAADPIEIQTAYQSAFRLLKEAEYGQAITAFDTFLHDYPDSQYADNARYWLGEAYFVTRQFGRAIAEYVKLIEDFPASNKAPSALLKIGHSYRELGQTEDARRYYQDVIDKYPGSSAAKEAGKELKQS